MLAGLPIRIFLVAAVQSETLADFCAWKSNSVLQHAVIRVEVIIGTTFAAPPADQPLRRLAARGGGANHGSDRGVVITGIGISHTLSSGVSADQPLQCNVGRRLVEDVEAAEPTVARVETV